MKRLITICVVMGMILTVTTVAEAAVLTIDFRPNDLLDLYPADYSGSKTTQDNARRLHETWASEFYNTFSDYMATGHTQPDDYNTYLNWRTGLGEGEGLNSFSTWLHGDTAARAWGEVLIADPCQQMSATVAAGSGWNVTITENEWDTGFGKGWIAVYWTTDSSKYIRPGGADLGTFSFTADLYVDTDENNNIAGDPDAVAGAPYRIWFADTVTNWDDDDTRALVFDDAGWGSLDPSYDEFASATAGDSALEAILTVPEPATMCLLGLGGLSLLRRKRQ